MRSDLEDAAARHPSGLDGEAAARRRRRGRWVLLGSVAVVLGVVTAVGAFGLSRDPRTVSSPLLGRPAPPFDLRVFDGMGRVRLADLRGKVVVINFWASWCYPCRVEHPNLAAAWERYRDQGVVILGIPFNDQPSGTRAYIRELGVGWPVLEDPGARTAIAYGVFGVPETFFIGADGRVAARVVGAVTYEDLTGWITRLLEERAG